MILNKNYKIPKDIEDSLNKFKKIITIIENNICLPKEDIIREIILDLDIKLDGARKIFRMYNPLDISIVKYILERKRTKTIKAIRLYSNTDMIDIKIREICQCSRIYFDKMLYKDHKIRVNNLLEDKDLYIPLVEKLDIVKIENNMINTIDYIYELEKSKIGKVDIRRTKVNIEFFD